MKLLIIRFSSIGDLTQALSIPGFVKHYTPEAEIHFVTRDDLSSLLDHHPHIQKIWRLKRELGLPGLFSLIRDLQK
jgi:ADP-heptose:LPS heptosyltransferase